MILYPAIDLKGGKVVRLEQGRADAETVYEEDASIPAGKFKEAGAEWIHVVDLDGAFTGQQANGEAVEAIIKSGLKVELGGGIRSLEAIIKSGLKVELGGGIRSLEVIKHWLDMGVERVIIGTKAVTDPNFLHECLHLFEPESIAVGIDAKDGKVAVKGWIEAVDLSAMEFAVKGWIEAVDLSAMEFARSVQEIGIHTIIYTDISRDGMMIGPNFEAQEEMLEKLEIDVIASGGVASIEDIRKFNEMAAKYPNLNGVITGKAIYDGELDIVEAIRLIKG